MSETRRHEFPVTPDLWAPGTWWRAIRRRPLLVFACAFLGLMAGYVWLARSEAQYRATATLLLDTESSGPPGLGALIPGSGGGGHAAELAILRSRAVAASVVAEPEDSEPDRAHPMRLGLTTLVEDGAFEPVRVLNNRLIGRSVPSGEVQVALQALDGDRSPVAEFEFLSRDQVRWRRLHGEQNGSWTEERLEPGRPLAHDSLMVHIEASGDCTGRRFLARTIPFEDAIDRVRGRTAVREAETNSGVIELSFVDSDPRRAAATANALAMSFIETILARGERKASSTASFIEARLAERQKALEEAQNEVTRLQSEDPKLLDLSGAAENLVTQRSGLERESVALAVRRAAIEEAIGALEGGEVAAVARIDPRLLDQATAMLVNEATRLASEVNAVDRSGPDQERAAEVTRLVTFRENIDTLELQAEWLVELVDSIDRGEAGAFSRFARDGTAGVAPDPMTTTLLDGLSRLLLQRDELSGSVTPEHPQLQAVEESITELKSSIREHAAARLDQVRSAITAYVGMVSERTEALGEGDEAWRERRRQTLARTQARILEHLRNRRAGIMSEERASAAEIARIEADLAKLPAEKQRLAEPLLRLQSESEVVRFLTKSLQDAQIVGRANVKAPELLDPAIVPRMRHAPRASTTLLVALLAGLVAGILLVTRSEASHGPARHPRQLERMLGVPVLETIPVFDASNYPRVRDLLPFVALRDAPASRIAGAYRRMGERLLTLGRRQGNVQIVGVTSSSLGEGNTTIAHNLALALASAGKRVLLIDGHHEAAHLHEAYGIPEAPGFLDMYHGGRSWRRLVRTTNQENLHIIAAGRSRMLEPDEKAVARLGRAFRSFKRDYDHVIFDFAPALEGWIDEEIVRQMEFSLLVYDGRIVTRRMVQRAMRVWKGLTDAPIAVVQNGHGELGAEVTSPVRPSSTPAEAVVPGDHI